MLPNAERDTMSGPLQCRKVEMLARLQAHETAAGLAQARVRHADQRRIDDGRVSVQQILHLHHRHVFATADDDVLAASGDADVAIGVQTGQIAGVEPVLVVHAVGLRLEQIAEKI